MTSALFDVDARVVGVRYRDLLRFVLAAAQTGEHRLLEAVPEVFRHEGVHEGVNAAVGVCKDVEGDAGGLQCAHVDVVYDIEPSEGCSREGVSSIPRTRPPPPSVSSPPAKQIAE